MTTPHEQKLSGGRSLSKIVAVNVVVLLLGLLAVELGGRVFFFFYPAHEVLFFEPDRVAGWKQLAGHSYEWTGMYWWAADYRAQVEVNSLGYRDRERELEKAEGTTRVVLLGESYAEAIQVPIEKTGAQLLEAKLNHLETGKRNFEVMNFSVSNYSVGQFLLAWEESASRFQADHVVIVVSPHIFRRTISRYERGAIAGSQGNALWVRPTFLLEEGALVRESPADYEEFVEAQRKLTSERFGGKRSRRRDASLLKRVFKRWSALAGDAAPVPEKQARKSKKTKYSKYSSIDILGVNTAVIRELQRQVEKSGATLSVIDMGKYLQPQRKTFSDTLRDFCAQQGIVLVSLSDKLLAANARGEVTRWKHDAHFNETGNQLFADAMFEALVAQGAVSTGRGRAETRTRD